MKTIALVLLSFGAGPDYGYVKQYYPQARPSAETLQANYAATQIDRANKRQWIAQNIYRRAVARNQVRTPGCQSSRARSIGDQ